MRKPSSLEVCACISQHGWPGLAAMRLPKTLKPCEIWAELSSHIGPCFFALLRFKGALHGWMEKLLQSTLHTCFPCRDALGRKARIRFEHEKIVKTEIVCAYTRVFG